MCLLKLTIWQMQKHKEVHHKVNNAIQNVYTYIYSQEKMSTNNITSQSTIIKQWLIIGQTQLLMSHVYWAITAFVNTSRFTTLITLHQTCHTYL